MVGFRKPTESEAGMTQEQSPVTAGLRRLVSPTPLEWFYLVGGLFLAMSYLWFMDDAFIYFRYVDNLLFLKLGLVYNAGEFVEGYSSPLWVLLLIGLRATGMSYKAIVQLGCGVSFAAFWYMLVLLNRRMAPPDAPQVNFPLAYLGFNYAVLSYLSSGLETPLVQAGAAAYALYLLVPQSRILQVCIGLSPLVRHELILPMLIVSVWGWWRMKRPPYPLLVTVGVTFSAWMLFRVYYYADLHPNTYYLEIGENWSQGFGFLVQTVYVYYLPETCLLSALIVLSSLRAGRRVLLTERAMMVLAGLPVALYVMRTGGGPDHYRTLAFPFILTVCALAGNIELLAVRLARPEWRRWAPRAGLGIALLVFTLYPPQLSGSPFLFHVKAEAVDGIGDAAGHRNQPDQSPAVWESRVNPEILRRSRASQLGFEYEDAVALDRACKAYEQFRCHVFHLTGFTDAILARVIVPVDWPAEEIGPLPLGHDLAAVRQRMRYAGPGMYRESIKRGFATPWIEDNLDAIEMLERKIYNKHDLRENLRLAFTTVPPIFPFPVPLEPGEGEHEAISPEQANLPEPESGT